MKKRAKFESYDPEHRIYASYDGTAGGQPAYDPHMKGNASKRKAMSYGRMEKRAADLKKESEKFTGSESEVFRHAAGIYLTQKGALHKCD